MKAQIEQTLEETQRYKDEIQIGSDDLAEKKKVLAQLMGELATRMSLPETQTKEISTLELENRELKKRLDEMKGLWNQSTNEVE